MRLNSKACHIQEGLVVVSVMGWIGNKEIGNALGQGKTVEEAEDKAIARLKSRIANNNDGLDKQELNINNNENKPNSFIDSNKEGEILKENKSSVNVPEDWSNELAAIDNELKRLKWKREDEINFLMSTFGYNNRRKITSYEEIKVFLQKLKSIDNGTSAKQESLKTILIKESDKLLSELSWDLSKGRTYIKKHFNVLSRNDLNESQLKEFNDLLLKESNNKI